MADYLITFSRSARKELEALSDALIGRIFSKIESLGSNPRPAGTKKLEGEEDLYRIRIGDYRVLYAIDDSRRKVDVVHIRHRRDAYRGFD